MGSITADLALLATVLCLFLRNQNDSATQQILHSSLKCHQKQSFLSQSGLDKKLDIHPLPAGHSLAPCQVSLMLHFDK